MLFESDDLEQAPALSERFADSGYLFFRDVMDTTLVAGAAAEIAAELRRQGVVANEAPRNGASVPSRWSGQSATDLDEKALYAGNAHKDLVDSARLRILLEHLFGGPVFVYRHSIIRYSLPSDDIHLTPAHQDHRFIGPNDDFRTVWIPSSTSRSAWAVWVLSRDLTEPGFESMAR